MANKNTVKTAAKDLNAGDKIGPKTVQFMSPMSMGFVRIYFVGQDAPMQVAGTTTFQVTPAPARKLRVVNASKSEGPLYQARGEDEDLFCFDSTVTVLAEDGKVYRHRTFFVKGALPTGDGYSVPNYNYKNEVQAFIERIEAKGLIDLRHWEEVPAGPTQAEREEYNLRCEQEERAGF